jgi:exopolysaccharide biosynthesis WecB/TagA/CpsF family protein
MAACYPELQALLDRLNLVPTDEGADDLLAELRSVTRPVVFSFLNAHGVNLAWKDDAFRRQLLESDFLVRDGAGIKIALKFFGREPGRNLNGTDFIPRILDAYRGRRAVLLGTREPHLSDAARRVESNYGVKVSAVLDGFRPDSEYVETVANLKPELVILAMGMPKQERVAEQIRARCDFPCLIVNGGAVLDFISEKVIRAPLWVRSHGLEWAWRLVQEPKRMWKRYLIGNFSFLSRAFSLSVRSRFVAIKT